MPIRLQEIVDDCTTLHDYPAEFCLAQPQEILQRINELCKEFNIDLRSVKTKKDRIIEMYEKGMDMERIARELGAPQHLVKTILTRRRQDP